MDDIIGSAAPAPAVDRDAPRVSVWWAFPIGVSAALVGLLPWLVTGARLPLQYLWRVDVTAHLMPITLLPFSQYGVVQIFSFVVVGSAVAGVTARALRLGGWGVTLVVAGLLLVQATATVQTTVVVIEGLQERLESTIYVVSLATGAGLSILIGLVVALLIAAAPRAGALLGLTVGAIGAASWFGALAVPVGTTGGPFAWALVVVPWITPVLTGIAIAWAGVNTVGRILAALVAIALVWIAPPVTTAITDALASTVLLRSPTDLIDYAVGVFRTMLFTPAVALTPVIVTVAVAVIGLVARAVAARRARADHVDDPLLRG